jgi:hypothetical protein
MRNEADVKKEVKKVLDSLGVYWFMPVQTGYGVKGIPDFVCCIDGLFLGIETKFGSNQLSTWQERQRDKILAADGVFMRVDETNVVDLAAYITAIRELENGSRRK